MIIYVFTSQGAYSVPLNRDVSTERSSHACADLEGGGGHQTPWNLQSLISPILRTGNEKISYFLYLCTSTVIRQTESILLKVGPPPLEKFSGSAPDMYYSKRGFPWRGIQSIIIIHRFIYRGKYFDFIKCSLVYVIYVFTSQGVFIIPSSGLEQSDTIYRILVRSLRNGPVSQSVF